MPICAKPCKKMPKVVIDFYDAQLLCGVVCDFLYLNEKNWRKLRNDHERIKAAKDRLAAILQTAEDDWWKETK